MCVCVGLVRDVCWFVGLGAIVCVCMVIVICVCCVFVCCALVQCVCCVYDYGCSVFVLRSCLCWCAL